MPYGVLLAGLGRRLGNASKQQSTKYTLLCSSNRHSGGALCTRNLISLTLWSPAPRGAASSWLDCHTKAIDVANSSYAGADARLQQRRLVMRGHVRYWHVKIILQQLGMEKPHRCTHICLCRSGTLTSQSPRDWDGSSGVGVVVSLFEGVTIEKSPS